MNLMWIRLFRVKQDRYCFCIHTEVEGISVFWFLPEHVIAYIARLPFPSGGRDKYRRNNPNIMYTVSHPRGAGFQLGGHSNFLPPYSLQSPIHGKHHGNHMLYANRCHHKPIQITSETGPPNCKLISLRSVLKQLGRHLTQYHPLIHPKEPFSTQQQPRTRPRSNQW